MQQEIHRLQTLRDQLSHDSDQQAEDYIKSLAWTKECTVKLYIQGWVAAGMPIFELVVSGNFPEIKRYKSICVAGSNTGDNYQSIYCLKDFDGRVKLSTNNCDLLIDFFKKNKFKKIEFDENYLELLSTLKQLQKGVVFQFQK